MTAQSSSADGSIRSELRELVRLAAPLAAAHFGQVLLGAVDMAVVGRMGQLELGAAGLGSAIYFAVIVAGLGVMLGLDPLIAQALGASEELQARRLLWQGTWMAILLSVPLTLLVALAAAVLGSLGIDAATARITAEYMYPRAVGLLPFLVFVGCRSYLQAVGITRPIVVGVVLANVVNLPMSWLLVFGDAGLVRFGISPMGIPALGAAGAAWTSSFCTVLQLSVLWFAVRSVEVPDDAQRRRPRRELLAVMGRLGAPIGATLLAEVGMFALVNLLAGNIGSGALAGHQVAINLAALTFMVPVGIGAAASVRVGRAVGRGDAPGTRRAGFVALAAGGAFMSLAALAFFLVPAELTRIISDKESVIEAAVPLVLVAAVFQLSDGAQAVAAGALRGAGDTRWPLFANLLGHYAVGLPVAVGLGFGAGWGASGLWWGLSAGLTAVALILVARFARLTLRPIARV